MTIPLDIDNVYTSREYGLVKYLGTCSVPTGAGFCHKFETTELGIFKYVQPTDLETFLEVTQNGS